MSDNGFRPAQAPLRVALNCLGVVLFLASVAAETYVIVQQPQIFGAPVAAQVPLRVSVGAHYKDFLQRARVRDMRVSCMPAGKGATGGVIQAQLWIADEQNPRSLTSSIACETFSLQVKADHNSEQVWAYVADAADTSIYTQEHITSMLDTLTKSYH